MWSRSSLPLGRRGRQRRRCLVAAKVAPAIAGATGDERRLARPGRGDVWAVAQHHVDAGDVAEARHAGAGQGGMGDLPMVQGYLLEQRSTQGHGGPPFDLTGDSAGADDDASLVSGHDPTHPQGSVGPDLDKRLWLYALAYTIRQIIFWPPDRAESDGLEVTHPPHTLRRLTVAPLPRPGEG